MSPAPSASSIFRMKGGRPGKCSGNIISLGIPFLAGCKRRFSCGLILLVVGEIHLGAQDVVHGDDCVYAAILADHDD